ncbi:hypothetical protein [Actinophytocola gossypii]|uniref:MucR family transcriptional regulator n=1 Tax=Actinophytocola gossypii TaxID=2812003 RepID=A0ABT2J4Z2_9PSEU|nr:hypothetical protein [Actinophytocola gossypii]MCT2582565.1 hypothetical protein [Actinophytocola gossypii]
MMEPTGPLPAGVYWRRRAVAAGACVLAVVVLAWVIGGFVGSADDEPVRGTGSSRDLASAPSSPAVGSSRPASGTSAPASATSSRRTSPAPTVTPTTPPPATTVPPAPLKPCPDSSIKVVAKPDAPSYRVGERPLLHLLVLNAGKVPCTRDVSHNLRELLVHSADGKKRLWSSNDCYQEPGTDQRVLEPGKPLTFELRWAGRTSAPGCPVDRTRVPAGTYRVVGKLGALTGAPTPLRLTP